MKTILKLGFIVTLPFCLLLIFWWNNNKEGKCAYVALLMLGYWTTEALPLAVTSLLPVVLFPYLGIISTEVACSKYIQGASISVFSCVVLSIAVQQSNLNQRIAYKVLLTLGTSPKRLLMGCILSTTFLSMWMSNSGVTALMLPVIDVICNENQLPGVELDKVELDLIMVENGSSKRSKENGKHDSDSCSWHYFSKLRKILYLSVASSANIGGTGTLIGSPSILVMQGIIMRLYPQSNEVTFANWLLYSIPCLMLCSFLVWLVLEVIYLRRLGEAPYPKQESKTRKIMEINYNKLGGMKFKEVVVLCGIMLFVLLELVDVNNFLPRLSKTATSTQKSVRSATTGCAIVLLLFVIPESLLAMKSGKAILKWKEVEKKFPWGLLLLLGGGFSLVEGFKESGLSALVQHNLKGIPAMEHHWLVLAFIIFSSLLTEVISNTVATTILLPIAAETAEAVGMNPLQLMIPITIATCFAFMFPVATIPNAIVYNQASMSMQYMMVPGIILSFLCSFVSFGAIFILGPPIFQTATYPNWIPSRNFTFEFLK